MDFLADFCDAYSGTKPSCGLQAFLLRIEMSKCSGFRLSVLPPPYDIHFSNVPQNKISAYCLRRV